MPEARRHSAVGVTALFTILALPGLPISRWENEFAGVRHLIGYEIIWWTLIIAVLLYVRTIEARPLSSVGFRKPSLWGVASGIGAGVAILTCLAAMYLWLLPLLHVTEAAQVQQIANTPLWWRFLSAVRAAVGEEIIFRGFAIERGREVFGSLRAASFLSWIVFTAEHVPTWGWSHLLVAGCGGLLLTLLYLLRRNLWTNILAHFIVDGASFLLA